MLFTVQPSSTVWLWFSALSIKLTLLEHTTPLLLLLLLLYLQHTTKPKRQKSSYSDFYTVSMHVFSKPLDLKLPIMHQWHLFGKPLILGEPCCLLNSISPVCNWLFHQFVSVINLKSSVLLLDKKCLQGHRRHYTSVFTAQVLLPMTSNVTLFVKAIELL